MEIARLFIEKCQCECILTVDGKEKNLIIPSGNKIHIINIDTIDDFNFAEYLLNQNKE